LGAPAKSSNRRSQIPASGSDVRILCQFFRGEAKPIVEVDGGQHAIQTGKYETRTKVLQEAGFIVLRFWNNEVMSNVEGVLAEIGTTAKSVSPHPVPLPWGEGTMLQREQLWR
jgi:hypothetical protein